MRVMMTAAHAGYGSERVPLGGAASVCEQLVRQWTGRTDLALTVVGSSKLLDRAPSSLDTREYAQFCRAFGELCTRLVLDQRPDVVVCHDVSEGPDFAALARAGIPCVTIFHVDVVDFFCRIYFRGLPPAKAVSAWRLLRGLPLPETLRLVFDKQEAAVRFSARLVLPSPGMADVIRACFGDVAGIEIVPWGAPVVTPKPQVRGGGPVILTLSRLSPEKGHELLLDALAEGERRGEVPAGLEVVICGAPAFMWGRVYAAELQRRAQRLRDCRVVFAGHAGGAKKAALFARADLFVAPSRYETYCLSLIEAMAHGVPVVARRTYGTEHILATGGGRLVEPGPGQATRFWSAIRDLLANGDARARLAAEARANAERHPFSAAAERLHGILCSVAAGQTRESQFEAPLIRAKATTRSPSGFSDRAAARG